MSQLKRLIITLVLIAGSFPALYWLLTEGLVLYEMESTGASARSDLEDDYWLGFMSIFFALPLAMIGAVLLGIFCWIRTRPASER